MRDTFAVGLVGRIRHGLQRYVLTSIERKLAVAFVVVALVPLLSTALYGHWVTSRILTEQAVETAQADLNVRASRIASYLQGVRGDLLYLSRLDALRALIDAREAGDHPRIADLRAQVGREFAHFALTHPEYYQIRYIAEDGREFVRVNARHGVVEIVPSAGLQLKFHRYYFQETMRLREGQIYVSPVDLNREYGRLEFPYTPVIRYATPLFFANGHRAGILILNLYAAEFLRFVYEAAPRQEMRLVDQDGYYMVHPDPEKTWGHPWDRATGYRLQLDYPRHWPQILRPRPGALTAGNDVIVHLPVFPDAENPNRYWVLLRVQPKPVAFASVQAFRVTASGILLLAVGFSLLMAALLAHDIAAPIRRLTDQVRRLGRGERVFTPNVSGHDEVAQLAQAFAEMEAALRQHLERLEALDMASRRIVAHLDPTHIFRAVLDALDRLFDAACKVVRVADASAGGREALHLCGDPAIAARGGAHAEARRAREAAASQGTWQPARIPWENGEVLYMNCVAVQTASRLYGWLELYAPHPDVIDPAVGNLLTSLALQAATALENAALYQELKQQREQLRTLIDRLITVQEEERRRIAYDLHDGLIQRLVGARLYLLSLNDDGSPPAGETRDVLRRAVEQVSAAIAEARRTVEGLRPPLLDELGLVAALEAYALDLSRQGGWHIHFDAPPRLERLPESVEISAFRIAQEALNNVLKYAQARHVHVRLWVADHTLHLEIQDDGVGFDVAEAQARRRCVGLTSMQERARLLGGQCRIQSRPGEGTRVSVRLPLPAGELTMDVG